MNLLLVESPTDIEVAIDYQRHSTEHHVLLALSPEVMRSLDHSGATYKTPEDYVDRYELNKLGQDNFQRVEELGRIVENHLSPVFQRAGLQPVNPVYLDFFNFKVGYDSYTYRVHELLMVAQLEKPSRIVWFSNAPAISDRELMLGLGGSEPIYSILAPTVASHLGVVVERGIDQRSSDERGERSVAPVSDGSLGRRGRVADTLLDRVRSFVAYSVQSLPSRHVIFVLGEEQDVPDIRRLLQATNGYRVLDARLLWSHRLRPLLLGESGNSDPLPERTEAVLEEGWAALRNDASFKLCFSHQGISWFDLVSDWLERFFTRDFASLIGWYGLGRKIARKYQPRCLLTLHSADPDRAAFGSGMQAEGVTVIYSQEGGNYGYGFNPMNHYADLCLADYFLAYGPGVVNQCRSYKPTLRQRAVAVATGSVRLSDIRTKSLGPSGSSRMRPTAPGDRKLVAMYLPARFHHSIVYSYSHADRVYFDFQRRLLGALREFPSVRVVVKLPTTAQQECSLIDYVKEILPECSVCTEPFPSVFGIADVFIIDWASTVLLEALLTSKPVYVFMDEIVARPESEALKLLRRRASVSTNFSSFLDNLRRYLANPAACEAEMDLTNTDFLEAYGCPVDANAASFHLREFFESQMKARPERSRQCGSFGESRQADGGMFP